MFFSPTCISKKQLHMFRRAVLAPMRQHYFFRFGIFRKKGRNSEKKQKQQVFSANFETFLAPTKFSVLNKEGFLPIKGKNK